MNGLIIILLLIGAIAAILLVNYYFIPPENRYPDIVGYRKVWAKLTPAQQRQFKKRFFVDVKQYQYRLFINVRPLHKVFCLLNESPKDKNVDSVFIKDRGNGLRRSTRYYTNEAAIGETKNDVWSLLSSREEFDNIIELLPGKTKDERIDQFITLFELDLYGRYIPSTKEWKHDEVMDRSEICVAIHTKNNEFWNYMFIYNKLSNGNGGYVNSLPGLRKDLAVPTLVYKKSSL